MVVGIPVIDSFSIVFIVHFHYVPAISTPTSLRSCSPPAPPLTHVFINNLHFRKLRFIFVRDRTFSPNNRHFQTFLAQFTRQGDPPLLYLWIDTNFRILPLIFACVCCQSAPRVINISRQFSPISTAVSVSREMFKTINDIMINRPYSQLK